MSMRFSGNSAWCFTVILTNFTNILQLFSSFCRIIANAHNNTKEFMSRVRQQPLPYVPPEPKFHPLPGQVSCLPRDGWSGKPRRTMKTTKLTACKTCPAARSLQSVFIQGMYGPLFARVDFTTDDAKSSDLRSGDQEPASHILTSMSAHFNKNASWRRSY